MAEIELVIKIDENKLWSLKNESIKENFNIYELASYIDKGIPLPKGHGDLIDRRELKENVVYIIKDLTGTFHNVIHESSVDDAQTIIKADMREKHTKTEIKEESEE